MKLSFRCACMHVNVCCAAYCRMPVAVESIAQPSVIRLRVTRGLSVYDRAY